MARTTSRDRLRSKKKAIKSAKTNARKKYGCK